MAPFAPNIADVCLIGAGPIGIEMAIALKADRIPYCHFESRTIGSTILAWSPLTRFYSRPECIALGGLPIQNSSQERLTREEYLTYLRNVVDFYGLDIRLNTHVTALSRNGDCFTLQLRNSRGDSFVQHCLSVIVAFGSQHSPRKPNVPGSHLAHVGHFSCDPHIFFRQHVLIVGGRHSAVDAAVRCWRAGAKHVTLSYRGESLPTAALKPHLVADYKSMMRSGKATFLGNTEIKEIRPNDVVLQRAHQAAKLPIATLDSVDHVVFACGYDANPSLFADVGVRLSGEGQRPCVNLDTMETNVQGLYVIGTAAAGTQQSGYDLFIENTLSHVTRVRQCLRQRLATKNP
jgi:thioredoxin reductase (NADPH)